VGNRLTCSCGEKFEVAAEESRAQVPCQACGLPVAVRQEGLTGLSTSKYLQPKAEVNLEELPKCRSCHGTGKCQACGGVRGEQSDLARQVGFAVFLAAMGRVFAAFLEGMFGTLGAADSKYCPVCNGKGRCRMCKGVGRVEERQDG